MKFLLPPALVFFILFPPLAVAQKTAETYPLDKVEQTAGRGLVLHTEPEGATVYIDGVEQRGVTPMTLDRLGGAEYNIRLFKEGYAERKFRAPVPSGSRLSVTMELRPLMGTIILTIRSEAAPDAPPFQPSLYIDGLVVKGSLLSQKPEGQRITIPQGWRRLQVRAFGWETQSRQVLVGKDDLPVDFMLRPAAFAFSGATLERRRVNPLASGAAGRAEIRYSVSGPGGGRFLVKDAAGAIVREEPLRFEAPEQDLSWSGKDAAGRVLPDGDYTLTVEASGAGEPTAGQAAPASFSFQVTLDSGFSVYPLSIPAGQAGLALCPLPETIPRGSFQLEGGLLFGAVPDNAEPWTSLPGEAALRFSPLDGLEAAAFLGLTPYFDGDALWGAGAAAHYRFLNRFGFSGAAAAAFVWAEEGASPFLGPGAGLTVSAPFAWRKGFFTLALSPGLVWYEPWSDDDSYPAGSARLLFPTGVLFRHRVFSAGLSCRADVSCGEGNLAAFKAGAEIRIHPTSLVFSLAGGAGVSGGAGEWTGWGGAFVGVVY